jgi:hypothetical protein
MAEVAVREMYLGHLAQFFLYVEGDALNLHLVGPHPFKVEHVVD